MPGSERWRPVRVAAFLGIGLLLYLALWLWSDALVLRTGDRNPFFRIAGAEARQDWLILGASHAMPLDFAETEAGIEAATGQRLLNLAVTGTGPFVWRLVAERFLADHDTAAVLIVADGFALRDRRWNQDRVGDTDLMRRIPADLATLRVLARAVPRGLPLATLADYAAGFSRINNPDRFRPDRWEAEASFDTAPRPSDAADRARIAYLYPGPADAAAEGLAFAELDALIALAQGHGARVVLLRPPLPDRFRQLLPDEQALAGRLSDAAAARGVTVIDHSALLPESRFYFDPDHLNRAGVAAWLDRGLRAILTGA